MTSLRDDVSFKHCYYWIGFGIINSQQNAVSKKRRLHTKTVMPCSLQSIAAAHSKRLTTTHRTENLSSPSLPENTKARESWLWTVETFKRRCSKKGRNKEARMDSPLYCIVSQYTESDYLEL